ncbi:MAG: hypothetical protein K6E75_03235 [Lachnospiraceae bacterium]|nr:hypothetical protein [Lachnospiraceae bacterium]
MTEKSKAELREEIRKRKQDERDRVRRIKKANKMLIVMPKKTQRSLGLIQYDPSGVFHFLDGRWMKVFQISGGISHLPDALLLIGARATFTHRMIRDADSDVDSDIDSDMDADMDADANTYYLSLFREGETYEPVRKAFSEDEETLKKSLQIRSLTAEETIEEIRKLTTLLEKPFDFPEFMKKRRDLLSETVPKITADYSDFSIKGACGSSYFIMQYPGVGSEIQRTNDFLRDISDVVFITTELCAVSQEQREEQIRYLKTRYLGHADERSIQPYVNTRIRIMMLCHDTESLGYAKANLEEAFYGAGYVISPLFGQQKESAESVLTLGMAQQGSLQNVPIETIREIFAKEHEHDPDKI